MKIFYLLPIVCWIWINLSWAANEYAPKDQESIQGDLASAPALTLVPNAVELKVIAKLFAKSNFVDFQERKMEIFFPIPVRNNI